jgi:hypothetical protein
MKLAPARLDTTGPSATSMRSASAKTATPNGSGMTSRASTQLAASAHWPTCDHARATMAPLIEPRIRKETSQR